MSDTYDPDDLIPEEPDGEDNSEDDDEGVVPDNDD